MTANPLRQLREDRFDYWAAQHLLNRAGFGGTPSQVRTLANLGLKKAVDFLVNFESVPVEPVESDRFDPDIISPLDDEERRELVMARRNGDEVAVEQFRQRRQAAQRADRQQIVRVKRWWLERMIETPRPLQEKLTLFWHGHFATGYRKIEDSYHMYRQNQLFRRHATGDFKTLTKQIIRDPAMIRYLDNHRNLRRAPNENLARELMELFTLGEGNVYSENDIKQGARALTGYTYRDNDFYFNARQHDEGQKSIMGHIGKWGGDDFVDIILSQRVCSEYICHKLYRFFVNDEPGDPTRDGQQFVKALARKFRDNNFEIAPTLTAMFMSEHFYGDAHVAAQIKSPIQLIVQAVRSLRAPTRDLDALVTAADLMGQNILQPPSVKGWDGGRAWINTSTLFVRQNTMVYLLTGVRPDAYPWAQDRSKADFTHLIDHLGDDPNEIPVRGAVEYLLRFNLGREPASQRVDTLVQFVEERGGRISNDMIVALLSLITAMPEYQLC